MKLSSAHKKRLTNVARFAAAGAMVVSSLSVAVVSPASAEALTENRTTISNSRPAQGNVQYAIRFNPTISTTAIAQVAVKFCEEAGSFSATCTAPAGMDATSSFAGASATGLTAGNYAQVGANSFTYDVDTPAAHVPGTPITLTLVNTVTNPTNAGTYFTRVETRSALGSGAIDEGTSAFAILQSVQVSGRVLEQMTFTVNGVADATPCGTYASSNIATTATTVPFGNFNSGTPRTGCQTISTSTNAVSGYTTTVRQYVTGNHPAGAMCRQTAADCTTDGATIAGIAVGNVLSNTTATLNNTPAAWVGTGTGIFGLGVGANGSQTAGFSADEFRGFYNGANANEAVTVASTTGPSDGTAQYVVFKADVPATQTAGVYQNRLMYISTPTF